MRTLALTGLGLCLALAGPAKAQEGGDFCTAPLPVRGEPFEGPVLWIIDGDGLCVPGPDGRLIEVRLHGFNAPEWSEPGGVEAFDDLAFLTLGREIRCVPLARSYDRIVADCTLDGVLIGDLLRAEGHPEGGRGHRRPAKVER